MQQKQRIITATLIGIILAISGASCGGYGRISGEAYEFATALYSICNRRDKQRLETFSAMLEEARAAEELTPDEADWMDEIVTLAETGEWDAAMKQSRRLLMDQVRGGP